jgi:hypothetical protein
VIAPSDTLIERDLLDVGGFVWPGRAVSTAPRVVILPTFRSSSPHFSSDTSDRRAPVDANNNQRG